MNRKQLVAPMAVALAVLAISSVATASHRRVSAGAATVTVAFNKHLKTNILVDATGKTLYMFTADTAGKATCAAADPSCPKLWPAFATVGRPRAGEGAIASLLGTTRGAGGVQQVTYNHHPLYHFHGVVASGGDLKPGDIKGQAFYGVWYVLSPKGNAIE